MHIPPLCTSHPATEHLLLTRYCTRKVLVQKAKPSLRAAARGWALETQELTASSPQGCRMTLLPPLLFLSRAMVRQDPSFPTRAARQASAASPSAANVRSKASVCSNTVMTANLFQEKNHHAPNQPLFIHLYFWFSWVCHRKGSGRFPSAHAEFAILLSLLSVTVRGLLEGGIRLRSLQPSALWVLYITPGCWLPSKDSVTSLLGMGKGVVQNTMGFPQT